MFTFLTLSNLRTHSFNSQSIHLCHLVLVIVAASSGSMSHTHTLNVGIISAFNTFSLVFLLNSFLLSTISFIPPITHVALPVLVSTSFSMLPSILLINTTRYFIVLTCSISCSSIYTRAQSLTGPCPCATCNWLLHPASTSAQGAFDLMQLALGVFSCHHFSAKSSLAVAVGIICNLHWWCSSCANLCIHYNVHTWFATMRPPPTTTCTGGVFPLLTRHLLM